MSSHDDDMIENQRNDEGMQDDESDNDFTFNDAETESDSDDNQSNQDVQRSVQTGANVGSETGKVVRILEICIYVLLVRCTYAFGVMLINH